MTVKGYGTSEAGEASNETHSLKKLDPEKLESLQGSLWRAHSDKDLKDVPFYRSARRQP